MKYDTNILDLISKTLIYDPSKRLTAVEVLAHPYFDEIRNKNLFSLIEKKINTKDFFYFDKRKLFP